MPIPRIVRQWNKVGLNRVTRHIAPRMPGFGVVVHRRRRSGRRYQTPVNVFATDDGYVLALTYGPDTNWVKNVLAAGGCELRTRGRVVRLVSPRLFHDEARHDIRPLERQVLGLWTSLTSCPSRPHLQPRQRLTSPECLSTGAGTGRFSVTLRPQRWLALTIRIRLIETVRLGVTGCRSVRRGPMGLAPEPPAGPCAWL